MNYVKQNAFRTRLTGNDRIPPCIREPQAPHCKTAVHATVKNVARLTDAIVTRECCVHTGACVASGAMQNCYLITAEFGAGNRSARTLSIVARETWAGRPGSREATVAGTFAGWMSASWTWRVFTSSRITKNR